MGYVSWKMHSPDGAHLTQVWSLMVALGKTLPSSKFWLLIAFPLSMLPSRIRWEYVFLEFFNLYFIIFIKGLICLLLWSYAMFWRIRFPFPNIYHFQHILLIIPVLWHLDVLWTKLKPHILCVQNSTTDEFAKAKAHNVMFWALKCMFIHLCTQNVYQYFALLLLKLY